MTGRFFLAGLILLVLFMAAVFYTLPPPAEMPPRPLSVDLVVVGSGIPALTAVLEASIQGAEVLLLDNRDLADEFPYPLGGRFVLPGEDDEEEDTDETEEENDIQGEEDELLDNRIRRASPGIQEEMLAVILAEAKATLDWLTRETGLSFYSREEDPDHIYGDSLSNPDMLREAIYQKVVPRLAVKVEGGELLALQFDADGLFAGMTFTDFAGRTKQVMARAIIFASGGYTGNREVMEEYNSDIAHLHPDSRRVGTGGEAFELLLPEGAILNHPSRVYMALLLKPTGTILTPANYPRLADALWFTEEGEEITEPALLALEEGDGAVKSFIKDSAKGRVELLFSDEDFTGARQSAIYVASSQELVEQTHMSRVQAEEVSQRFPPPYYLQSLNLEAFYTLGGIKTDIFGRVLTDGSVAPGIYALGETAGSLHGEGIYPGLPLTEALVMGRRVGREAVLFTRR